MLAISFEMPYFLRRIEYRGSAKYLSVSVLKSGIEKVSPRLVIHVACRSVSASEKSNMNYESPVAHIA